MSTKESMDVVEASSFRLEGQLDAPEIYADGFTNLFFGFPNTRVVFHSIVEPPHDGQKEQRRAVLTLTMPTVLALQLAHTMISGTKGNERLLMQTVDQQVKNLKNLVAAQPGTGLPEALIERDLGAAAQAKPKDD